MITRIEVTGFKTFTDFAVDLAPLTVIAGANASGKSNLFDVLRLLRDMATNGHTPSIQTRGGLTQVFTKYNKEETSSYIVIAVELLLPLQTRGYSTEFMERLEHNRWRYELKLRLDIGYEDIDAVEIVGEKLTTISEKKDSWPQRYLSKDQRDKYVMVSYGGPNVLIDSFSTNDENEKGRYQFGNYSNTLHKTALSETTIRDDKHLRAVFNAISSIELVDLAKPYHFSNFARASGNDDKQSNILRHLQLIKQYPVDLQYLSRRVNKIIKDIVDVDVYIDDFKRATVTATDTLGGTYVADLLSEGTLRVIALSTYLLGRESNRCLLIEEPENGVDPRVLNEMLNLLIDIVFSPFEEENAGLGQVLCTTHSPTFLQAALRAHGNKPGVHALLTTKVVSFVNTEGRRRKLPATRMNEIVLDADGTSPKGRIERYTLSQALDYLNQLRLPQQNKESLPDA